MSFFIITSLEKNYKSNYPEIDRKKNRVGGFPKTSDKRMSTFQVHDRINDDKGG
jgi:hypothetical protein